MSSLLQLLLLAQCIVLVVGNGHGIRRPCAYENCPELPPTACEGSVVERGDRSGCCDACAKLKGQACGLEFYNWKGRCDTGLSCLKNSHMPKIISNSKYVNDSGLSPFLTWVRYDYEPGGKCIDDPCRAQPSPCKSTESCKSPDGVAKCECLPGYIPEKKECVACGGSYDASLGGTIQSPNYPQNYPKKATCQYLIDASPGQVVKLSFEHFDVYNGIGWSRDDCGFDTVTVHDGNSSAAGWIGPRICGTGNVSDIVSSGNSMLIVFNSRSNEKRKGFLATYSQEDIVLNAPSTPAPAGTTAMNVLSGSTAMPAKTTAAAPSKAVPTGTYFLDALGFRDGHLLQ